MLDSRECQRFRACMIKAKLNTGLQPKHIQSPSTNQSMLHISIYLVLLVICMHDFASIM